jgi:hypothetical protein
MQLIPCNCIHLLQLFLHLLQLTASIHLPSHCTTSQVTMPVIYVAATPN